MPFTDWLQRAGQPVAQRPEPAEPVQRSHEIAVPGDQPGCSERGPDRRLGLLDGCWRIVGLAAASPMRFLHGGFRLSLDSLRRPASSSLIPLVRHLTAHAQRDYVLNDRQMPLTSTQMATNGTVRRKGPGLERARLTQSRAPPRVPCPRPSGCVSPARHTAPDVALTGVWMRRGGHILATCGSLPPASPAGQEAGGHTGLQPLRLGHDGGVHHHGRVGDRQPSLLARLLDHVVAGQRLRGDARLPSHDDRPPQRRVVTLPRL